jgi:hypothetical protein
VRRRNTCEGGRTTLLPDTETEESEESTAPYPRRYVAEQVEVERNSEKVLKFASPTQSEEGLSVLFPAPMPESSFKATNRAQAIRKFALKPQPILVLSSITS